MAKSVYKTAFWIAVVAAVILAIAFLAKSCPEIECPECKECPPVLPCDVCEYAKEDVEAAKEIGYEEGVASVKLPDWADFFEEVLRKSVDAAYEEILDDWEECANDEYDEDEISIDDIDDEWRIEVLDLGDGEYIVYGSVDVEYKDEDKCKLTYDFEVEFEDFEVDDVTILDRL